jgi:hypothetical protein
MPWMPCTPGTELNGKNDGSKHLSDRGTTTKQGALYDPDLHSHYVPLLELDRTNMTHPFTLSNEHLKYTVTDEVIAQWNQYFVVFFPLVFVLFPIIATCISAITTTIE